MHRVFVYGTLKRGYRNHRFLKAATFVGEAHTLTSYRMLDGRFPVLRDAGPGCMQISGEVYDVDEETLSALDDLEGIASGMYDRVEIGVILKDQPNGRGCRAFVYIGCGNYWDKKEQMPYSGIDRFGHLNWVAPNMRPK